MKSGAAIWQQMPISRLGRPRPFHESPFLHFQAAGLKIDMPSMEAGIEGEGPGANSRDFFLF